MAVDGVEGYLPPSGPQNVHGVPYRWIPGQGAHAIGNAVVYSPESLILTGNQQAQRHCERSDLDTVSDEVVEESLEAILEGEDERVEELVADYRAGDEDLAPAKRDRPTIPEDLSDVSYSGEDGEPGLQDYAQAHGIAANQSADELRTALAEVRDADSGDGNGGEGDDE